MRLVSTDMGLDAKIWVFHLGCVFLNFFCISGEIQLLNECCSVGTRWAIEKTHCDDYKYATDDIPRVWRGLCLTTLGMCCEKELGNQHCIAGRAAAREGSKCVGDHKFNSTFYTNCCKACQIGLAVAASGSNCSSTSLSYFTHDESYTICCNDNTNDDNTFILAENDDICGKVQNLCSHICENTRDSYACKCRPGFKLDENKVTCSPDENVAPIESDEDDETHEDCKVGYERNPRTKECGDIDECLEATSVCRNDQYCYNTPGSYSCLNIRSTECDTGFRFNTKTEACEDINECHDNPCAEGYTCINYAGHYDCRRSGLSSVRDRTPASPFPVEPCDPGYRFKHNKCIDIDECLTDKNACDSNQICVNVEGAYRCNCKIGFKMDATFNACVDLNECQINNHNCLPSQRCDNTIGSYTCIRLQSCGTGYTLNAETGNCDDDDECLLGRDDCPPSYTCRNTEGSFRCDRNKTARIFGTFTSTPTSSTVTSTISTSSSRSTKASTLPTPSKTPTTPRPTPIHIVPNYTRASSSHTPFISYQTRNTQEYVPSSTHRFTPDASCGYGFERNRMGACVDVDECQIQGGVCGSHQRCINTNGSYRCQNLLVCPGGYRATPNGTSCVDIDECETGEHNCGPDQTCRNRMGGYVCSCPPGHILSSGNRCVDINECEYQREQVCSINSNCINTVGSYYCECKPGFKKHNLNDKNCVDVDECEDVKGLCEQKCVNFWGSYRCACNPGFELASDNRTCTDINECEVHKSYNLCMGFCNNVPGSYECSCPPGYELGLDKNSCRDIDECSLPNICLERNEICTNIRGSYRCNVISCPYGYSLDPDQKNRCRLINHVCEGEECFQKPSAYTYNFITLVSKMLIPPQGRTLFTLRGPTWYENIDFDLKIARITAPGNVEKATDQYFSTNKMHNQVQLSLMRSLEGPQDIELELSMTVFMNDHPRGKSVAKILIIVSQYSF